MDGWRMVCGGDCCKASASRDAGVCEVGFKKILNRFLEFFYQAICTKI